MSTFERRLEADQERPVDDASLALAGLGDGRAVQQDMERVGHRAFTKERRPVVMSELPTARREPAELLDRHRLEHREGTDPIREDNRR